MNLEELQVLVTLADVGSQAAAARTLGLPRATLRRRMQQLEERLGVALVSAGPGGVELTEVALQVAEQARRVLAEADRLVATARDAARLVEGRIRLAVPVGIPAQMRVATFAWLREYHPNLRLEVIDCADPLGALESGVELAIHLAATLPEGPYESFPVAEVPERLAGSDDYFAVHGEPRTLADLADHVLLSCRPRGEDPMRLPRLDGGEVDIDPMLIANDMLVVRTAAAMGLGLALVPTVLLQLPDESEPPLRTVLPDTIGITRSISVVVHESALDLPRIQAVLELVRGVVGHPAVGGLFDALIEP